MKKILLFTSLAIPLLGHGPSILHHLSTSNMETTNLQDPEAIKALLLSYRDGLNASDVSGIIPLYTAEGVFMPQGAPTAVGKEQVNAAYEQVFSNIHLNIEFIIENIEVYSDHAYVRSTSKGTVKILATGEVYPEENRELFILKRMGKQWKIDQYMFNKMHE